MLLESPSRIEPCLVFDHPDLVDLASLLIKKSNQVEERLDLRRARIVNACYSNLIEGRDLSVELIESALNGDFDDRYHSLQKEAVAHVMAQEKIDAMHEAGTLPEPASAEFIRWLHREFYVTGDIVPGEYRQVQVAVGRHMPPSAEKVVDFMRYFENRYRFSVMSQVQKVLAIASAHHRLSYIHPFEDGNGRVGRFMSYAMGLHAGLRGIGSISEGLYQSGRYKEMMDMADMPRQGDLDGRGNLSQRALVDFTRWFLKVFIKVVEDEYA